MIARPKMEWKATEVGAFRKFALFSRPGGDGRRDLARDHGHGEVPGRDGRADAHGLAHGQEPPVGARVRLDLAGDARRLLGEPLDERRAVGDLAARLGEGLAALGRHERRDVLRRGQDAPVPLAERVAPLASRRSGPRGQRGRGRVDGGARLLRPAVRDVADGRAAARVDDGEGARRSDPGAADERRGLVGGVDDAQVGERARRAGAARQRVF